MYIESTSWKCEAETETEFSVPEAGKDWKGRRERTREKREDKMTQRTNILAVCNLRRALRPVFAKSFLSESRKSVKTFPRSKDDGQTLTLIPSPIPLKYLIEAW